MATDSQTNWKSYSRRCQWENITNHYNATSCDQHSLAEPKYNKTCKWKKHNKI